MFLPLLLKTYLFDRLRYLSAFRELLIEGNDGLDAFVEVVEAVVLVG